LQSSAAAAAVVATGGGVLFLLTRNQLEELDFGGINCAEARRLVPAYLAGELPAADVERLRRHATACPLCRPWFDRRGIRFA
jgi:hypothetical protein